MQLLTSLLGVVKKAREPTARTVMESKFWHDFHFRRAECTKESTFNRLE
jgi:hypothetical protein